MRSIASIRHARAALAEHPGDLTPDQIATKVSRNHASARRVQGRRGRAEKGKPLSDGALIREVVTLHAALQWAFDELWIERAPRIEAPPAPPMKERWLTPGEARRFLDATETLHDQSRHGQQQQAPVNRAHGSRAACRHVGCRYDPDE